MAAASWVVAVVVSERIARSAVTSRSRGLLLAYLSLGAVTLLSEVDRSSRTVDGSRGTVVAGLALTFSGYQLGRALLSDRPDVPPSESLAADTVALGIVVPVVEEAIWGARVEPIIGITATSLAFALKHSLVDGRWRRTLGLAAFWTGLALLRRRSRATALAAHVAANVGAVVLGHATGRDRF